MTGNNQKSHFGSFFAQGFFGAFSNIAVSIGFFELENNGNGYYSIDFKFQSLII